MRVGLRTVTVALLVLSLGLHWALLQTVAWAGMLIANAREVPLQVAVAKTFDGEHPCALCKVIQQGRAAEKSQESQQVNPGLKQELGVPWQTSAFFFAPVSPQPPSPVRRGLTRVDEPPKPRPRARFNHHARA